MLERKANKCKLDLLKSFSMAIENVLESIKDPLFKNKYLLVDRGVFLNAREVVSINMNSLICSVVVKDRAIKKNMKCQLYINDYGSKWFVIDKSLYNNLIGEI